MRVKKLLYVVNNGHYFLSHRLSLAKAAQEAGYEVAVAVPQDGSEECIISEGFHFYPLRASRSAINLWKEFLYITSIATIFRKYKPDIAHLITIKPVLYGNLVARPIKNLKLVYTIPGLGHVYTANDWYARSLRFFTDLLYRVAFRHPHYTAIFQNADDKKYMQDKKMLSDAHAVLIKSSGVDLEYFRAVPAPSERNKFVIISRLLWTKGLREFVEAARLVKKEFSAEFHIVGDIDSGNPASLTKENIESWVNEGVVIWHGWQSDVRYILKDMAIVCLPSYREGFPKVLLEAAACARPIIATDVPGCREIVENGVNGYLVAARSVDDLASAMRKALRLELSDWQSMADAGRKKVEEFSIQNINRQTLAVYDL